MMIADRTPLRAQASSAARTAWRGNTMKAASTRSLSAPPPPAGGAAPQRRADGVARQHDEGRVDRLGERLDARVCPVPQDLRGAGVDRVDAALVPALDDVLE